MDGLQLITGMRNCASNTSHGAFRNLFSKLMDLGRREKVQGWKRTSAALFEGNHGMAGHHLCTNIICITGRSRYSRGDGTGIHDYLSQLWPSFGRRDILAGFVLHLTGGFILSRTYGLVGVVLTLSR